MSSTRIRGAALVSLMVHAAILWWASNLTGTSFVSSAPGRHQERFVLELLPSSNGLRSRPAPPSPDTRPASHVAAAQAAGEVTAGRESAAAQHAEPAGPGHSLFALGEAPYLPASELDVRPTPIGPVILPYPDAPLGKPRATAILLLYVGSDGSVDRVEVEDSDLPAEFERVAVQTFRGARMQPGNKDGASVRALMKIVVEFESG